MSPRFEREELQDGSFIEFSMDRITPDEWRPHGYRYRLAWVQEFECRILFDNHYGKGDHFHVGNEEYNYEFKSPDQLFLDFFGEIRKLGGII